MGLRKCAHHSAPIRSGSEAQAFRRSWNQSGWEAERGIVWEHRRTVKRHAAGWFNRRLRVSPEHFGTTLTPKPPPGFDIRFGANIVIEVSNAPTPVPKIRGFDHAIASLVSTKNTHSYLGAGRDVLCLTLAQVNLPDV
ncbi:hypothetical protein GCM10007874_41230 [Labrys miyagiensis]|uniref:Uncharacterized protein n=1 Tax=Labrys miyagiensis TaxID=346912 RepID=A0ABQ6CLD5_9HYPH|nr:hypothetical protein GCM10007874_41230 [Labrys miyagiensis]